MLLLSVPTRFLMQTSSKDVMDIDKFVRTLKAHSLKVTPQRIAVHNAMIELEHASADMVRDYINRNSQTAVTIASVYNILTQLALFGFYRHRLSADNKMYFDVRSSNHIHLYDSVNNVYQNVFDAELISDVTARLKHHRFKGYKMDYVDILIMCHPTRRRRSRSIEGK